METEKILKKHKANEALVPAFMKEVYDQSREEVVPTEDPIKDEDLMLGLSSSNEWKILKRYINLKMDRLLELTRQSARGGMNPEETGLRFFVYDQLEAFGQDIISYVERAKNARMAGTVLKSNLDDE